MTIGKEEKLEIETLRSQADYTRRAISPGLEEILYQPIPVLDHGFIRVVDYMGSDAAIVQAARVSYGKGTRKKSDDESLIRYLMRHSHTTPFEMAEIKVHVRLPIFVARQWIRHRTASVNEYSARYSILDNEFYVPSPDALSSQSKDNRQGRGEPLSVKEASVVSAALEGDAQKSYQRYLWLLNEAGDSDRKGLARELARIGLPLSTYTQWYWKVDLHNLMHFVELRADAHAQFEIRAYAEELLKIMFRWVPLSTGAFVEYRMNAVKLSASAVKVLGRLLKGEDATSEIAGLTPRERDELSKSFGFSFVKASEKPIG